MFRPLELGIIHLDRTDSTNNYAATFISEGKARHGTVILADEQYSGRGQRGNSWISAPSFNLTFSIILFPDNLSAKDQFVLSKLVSLSIVDLLGKFDIPAQVKWPNDILVDRRKIAGVLIENGLSNGKVHTSLVGIGLNVNQIDFNGLNAVSMRALCGQTFVIKEVLFSFLASFDRILAGHTDGSIDVATSYLDKLYGFGESLQFRDDQGDFNGTIEAIDEYGRLIVVGRGERKSYDIKALSFIFENASGDFLTSD